MSLPRARAALKQMNRDTEHLRLLAIFHYVAAGLAAFFSSSRCFTQRSAGFSFLFRGMAHQSQARSCRPNLLAGFLLAWDWFCSCSGSQWLSVFSLPADAFPVAKLTPSRSSWLASNVSSFLSEQFSGYLRLWRCRENLLGRYFRQDNRERENRTVGSARC